MRAGMDAAGSAIDASAQIAGGRLLLNHRNLAPIAILINLSPLTRPRIGLNSRESMHIDIPIRAILCTETAADTVVFDFDF